MPEADVVTTAAFHLVAAKYFQIASFIMLVFDHGLTFGDEVERIWKRKMTGASALFLINRYGTPLQFAFIVNAFNDPSWSVDCERVVSFEGYTTVALVAVCELIMVLRIFALYSRNLWILGFLMVVLAAQVIISSYGLSLGFRLPLPPIFVGCIFAGPDNSLFPAVWYTPAITDFVIFVLTVARARAYFTSQSSASMPTIARFVNDGLLYFLVIFAANLSNVLIYTFAVPDLKAFGASFSQCITSVMINRLVLNLRGIGESSDAPDTILSMRMFGSQHNGSSNNSQSNNLDTPAANSFMTRTIGDLGEEIRPWGDDSWGPPLAAIRPQNASKVNTFELAQMANSNIGKRGRNPV